MQIGHIARSLYVDKSTGYSPNDLQRLSVNIKEFIGSTKSVEQGHTIGCEPVDMSGCSGLDHRAVITTSCPTISWADPAPPLAIYPPSKFMHPIHFTGQILESLTLCQDVEAQDAIELGVHAIPFQAALDASAFGVDKFCGKPVYNYVDKSNLRSWRFIKYLYARKGMPTRDKGEIASGT